MAQQARSSLLAVFLFFFSIQTVRASNSLLTPVTIYSSNLQQNTVNYQPLDSRHLVSYLYKYIKDTTQISSEDKAQQYAFLQPLVSSSSSLVVVVGQEGQHHPPPSSSSSTITHMQLPNAVQSVLLRNTNTIEINNNDDVNVVKALSCDPASPYYHHSTTEATSGNDLVVICPETNGQEAAILTTLMQSINNNSATPVVLVHITSPSPSSNSGKSASLLQQQRRRALLSTQQQYNTTGCDATCQRQVRYMEGFIVFVTLFLALSVGVTCMQLVDTPTRFLTAQGGGGHGRLHQD